MKRLGHIELGKQKVLNIIAKDNVVQIRLDNESFSLNVYNENVKGIKRGDIVCVDKGVGIVKWINERKEINIFVNGTEEVYVYKSRCWIKLSDFRRGDRYLTAENKCKKSTKNMKKKRSSNKKRDNKPITKVCSSNNIDRKSISKNMIKSRVALLMKSYPLLSAQLAEKVVRYKLPIAVALKMTGQRLRLHTARIRTNIGSESPYGAIPYGARGERYPLSSQGLAGDKRKRQFDSKWRRRK